MDTKKIAEHSLDTTLKTFLKGEKSLTQSEFRSFNVLWYSMIYNEIARALLATGTNLVSIDPPCKDNIDRGGGLRTVADFLHAIKSNEFLKEDFYKYLVIHYLFLPIMVKGQPVIKSHHRRADAVGALTLIANTISTREELQAVQKRLEDLRKITGKIKFTGFKYFKQNKLQSPYPSLAQMNTKKEYLNYMKEMDGSQGGEQSEKNQRIKQQDLSGTSKLLSEELQGTNENLNSPYCERKKGSEVDKEGYFKDPQLDKDISGGYIFKFNDEKEVKRTKFEEILNSFKKVKGMNAKTFDKYACLMSQGAVKKATGYLMKYYRNEQLDLSLLETGKKHFLSVNAKNGTITHKRLFCFAAEEKKTGKVRLSVRYNINDGSYQQSWIVLEMPKL